MDVQSQFQNACKNGNLEEAKILLQNNPNINISADNEWAFKLACEKGHLEVAQWLQTLNPFKYVIEVENNKLKSWKINTDYDKKMLLFYMRYLIKVMQMNYTQI